ncbi:MAG: helix-turn-helix transcriptional regulator, partial [Actinomycetota bacterium]|nr:helix-turn-helix transcriptional regulator [Actinomycetota bacterium]
MTRGKTYGQFCGLARALDHVGDRWTLLIVRELLLGPRTFAALQASLDGISPNLLVDRLRSLASDGIVRRNGAPARSKAVEYRLTDDGAALEPAVLAL